MSDRTTVFAKTALTGERMTSAGYTIRLSLRWKGVVRTTDRLDMTSAVYMYLRGHKATNNLKYPGMGHLHAPAL